MARVSKVASESSAMLLSTFFIVVANFVIDIVYAFLAPRVRYT